MNSLYIILIFASLLRNQSISAFESLRDLNELMLTLPNDREQNSGVDQVDLQNPGDGKSTTGKYLVSLVHMRQMQSEIQRHLASNAEAFSKNMIESQLVARYLQKRRVIGEIILKLQRGKMRKAKIVITADLPSLQVPLLFEV